MNNEKAFCYFKSKKNYDSISSISEEFVAEFALNDSQYDEIRQKSLVKRDFVRNQSLEIWNESLFYNLVRRSRRGIISST